MEQIVTCLSMIEKLISQQVILKKTGFFCYVYDLSVDYDAIAVGDLPGIHNYLMKKNHVV